MIWPRFLSRPSGIAPSAAPADPIAEAIEQRLAERRAGRAAQAAAHDRGWEKRHADRRAADPILPHRATFLRGRG